MRVSLPIMTVGRSPLGNCCSAASTLPAAKPSRMTKSGVIGASPTLPRMPSVPKYCLVMLLFLLSFHSIDHLQRLPGRPDVVDANDLGPAQHRQHRRCDAGVDPFPHFPAGDLPKHGLARQ